MHGCCSGPRSIEAPPPKTNARVTYARVTYARVTYIPFALVLLPQKDVHGGAIVHEKEGDEGPAPIACLLSGFHSSGGCSIPLCTVPLGSRRRPGHVRRSTDDDATDRSCHDDARAAARGF
jgi:hypothetical protein